MAPTLAPRAEDGGPINWNALHSSYIAAGVIVGFFVLCLACMLIWGPGWYRRRRAKFAAARESEAQELELANGHRLSTSSTQHGDSQPKSVHPGSHQAQTPVATTHHTADGPKTTTTNET
ncbi:axial budding pattern protein 2 [Microdochium nivale]|nr:axial budding pattern protein 2 [Microdochium nivale]